MAITDKEKGVWELDQVYNKINQGGIWSYDGLNELYGMGRNEQGQFIANDPNTSENEAWVGGKAPSVPKIKRKRKTKSKIQNALTNLLKND